MNQGKSWARGADPEVVSMAICASCGVGTVGVATKSNCGLGGPKWGWLWGKLWGGNHVGVGTKVNYSKGTPYFFDSLFYCR